MSLLLTLFGGMAMTGLLYALARRVHLSNFWAAVFAAAVPSLLYFGWAAATLPTVDRITIHLVAYPTVAVLLYQLYRNEGKTHWIPIALVVFFVLLSVLMGGFVYIASEGIPPALAARLLPNAQERPVHTGFSGVVAHQDEAAKSIGHRRNMESQLQQRGWRVDLSGLESLQQGRSSRLILRVTGAADAGVDGIGATLDLSRPGQELLNRVSLSPVGSGAYRGEAAALEAGVWVATLNLSLAGTRTIRLEQALEVSR